MPEFRPEDLADWTGGEWSALPAAMPSGVSHDTRTIRTGDLYVAIAGERYDGSCFVRQAFDFGASAAMVESQPEGTEYRPLLHVDDVRQALKLMARGHRRRLAGRICGITGSVGKTTVKEMLAGILSLHGDTSATLGNWNNDIGLPLSLLAMEPDDSFGVFEVAMNHPGEIAALSDILRPDCAVMCTVGLAHSQYFADVEGIAREKSSLLKALPDSGFALLSSDEEWFDLFRASTAARIVTVSLSGPADYAGRLDESGTLGISTGAEDFCVRLAQPGEHIARDALLAAAAAIELGAAVETVREGLESFRALSKRWERFDWNGVEIVNDAYNANLLSMKAALKTLARVECSGNRWAVLGGMNELGDMSAEAHREVGAAVAGSAERLLGIAAGGEMIVAAARQAGMSRQRTSVCPDTDSAAEILMHGLRAGDCVLLKASRSLKLERIIDRLISIENKEKKD